MKRLANTILLLCENEKCGRMMLVTRQSYEKGELTKDAVFLYDTCDRCQEEGNFYDESHYFGLNGEIDWSKEVEN